MEWDLWGLIVPVKVRHVYGAHCVCVEIINTHGELSGLWCTVRLPIEPPTVQRSSQCPPRLPLRLYDPDAPAHGDESTPQPGPCPHARAVLARWLRESFRVVAHLPIGALTFAKIAASRTVPGDLYLPAAQVDGQRVGWPGAPASALLIAAGLAKPLNSEVPHGTAS